MNQFTIAKEVSTASIGLHSGDIIHMTLKPAAPNSGIVFVRTDLGGASVRAHLDNIDFKMLQLATTLRNGDALVQTTEHLLSACRAAGVDNLTVELDGPEVPIMDGSSAPFLIMIEESGLKKQAQSRTFLEILKPFVLEDGEKRVAINPYNGFRVSYEIDFDHPVIKRQSKTITLNQANYENQIAPARTFGFLRDVTALQQMGLIRGGNMDNAVVLDGDRVLNGALRLPDEFVSHKILDLVGDFAVLPHWIKGHVTAYKAGHEMHARFLKALLDNPDCWRLVSAGAEETVSRPATPVAVPA